MHPVSAALAAELVVVIAIIVGAALIINAQAIGVALQGWAF